MCVIERSYSPSYRTISLSRQRILGFFIQNIHRTAHRKLEVCSYHNCHNHQNSRNSSYNCRSYRNSEPYSYPTWVLRSCRLWEPYKTQAQARSLTRHRTAYSRRPIPPLNSSWVLPVQGPDYRIPLVSKRRPFRPLGDCNPHQTPRRRSCRSLAQRNASGAAATYQAQIRRWCSAEVARS